MKHPRITTLVAGFVVVVALSAAAVAAAGRTGGLRTGSPEDQIRAVERARLQAAVDADTATAGRLVAPGFQLIDVLGTAESRSDFLANVGGRIDFVTLNPVSPIRVRVHGDTAVARFRVAFVVDAGPSRLEHDGWFTDALERREGRWQIVWSQTTAVPNDPALFVESLQAPH